MLESHFNKMHWILCRDLNLTSVDWNTLSSNDQRESSFLKSIAKFNLGLLKDKDFLQRDVLLTEILFLRRNCEINQNFSNHSALACPKAFEIVTEQIYINRYCIRKAYSESLRLFFLNNRLQCSNDANRKLEMFDVFVIKPLTNIFQK